MAKVEAPAQDTVPLEDVLARCRDLIPTLRERAARCEELRRIPDETVEDFKEAGIFRSTAPVRFGGLGLGADAVCEISMEIGRGDGSAGWMAGQWSGHNFMARWFSEEAQDEYFAGGPDAISSTASAIVRCERKPVPGGIRLSGCFKFSSGCDQSEWVELRTPDELCLVPRSDYTIDDDWFVAGLRGTGSKRVVFDDVFVPEHRILTNEMMEHATYPGSTLDESPWFKLQRPEVLVLPNMIVSQTIGMAQGVVDVFDERARTRKDSLTREPAFEREATQLDFGESVADVDAARELLRENLRELYGWGEAGGTITIEDGARSRRNITFANRLCVLAVDRLTASGDSSALYEENHLHRLARDARASALQFAVGWNETAVQYSRVRWGLEPQTPLV